MCMHIAIAITIHKLIKQILEYHYRLIKISLFISLCHTISKQIEQENHAISQFEDNSKHFLAVATKNRIEKNRPRFFEKSN